MLYSLHHAANYVRKKVLGSCARAKKLFICYEGGGVFFSTIFVRTLVSNIKRVKISELWRIMILVYLPLFSTLSIPLLSLLLPSLPFLFSSLSLPCLSLLLPSLPLPFSSLSLPSLPFLLPSLPLPFSSLSLPRLSFLLPSLPFPFSSLSLPRLPFLLPSLPLPLIHFLP